MALEQLEDFCAAHDLPLNDTARAGFATYLQLLERFNAKMNLIGPMEPAEVVDSLFCDSLVVGIVAEVRGDVLDVGSGAGFPGLPLAIMWPEARFTLVEPRQKRSQFLEIARRRLGVDNVDVVRARIEDVEPALFDLVCSKAFQPPPDWVATASQWCKPSGTVVALHAADARGDMLEAAQAAGLQVTREIADVTRLGLSAQSVVRSATAFGKAGVQVQSPRSV
jgi:16S rRNA (guanine527-N7)-methyltransferase